MTLPINLTPKEQRILIIKEIRQLSKEIKGKGYWIKGAKDQEILNPALAARRSCLETLRKLDIGSPVIETNALMEFNLDN